MLTRRSLLLTGGALVLAAISGTMLARRVDHDAATAAFAFSILRHALIPVI